MSDRAKFANMVERRAQERAVTVKKEQRQHAEEEVAKKSRFETDGKDTQEILRYCKDAIEGQTVNLESGGQAIWTVDSGPQIPALRLESDGVPYVTLYINGLIAAAIHCRNGEVSIATPTGTVPIPNDGEWKEPLMEYAANIGEGEIKRLAEFWSKHR